MIAGVGWFAVCQSLVGVDSKVHRDIREYESVYSKYINHS
jgi:hypothetical protein